MSANKDAVLDQIDKVLVATIPHQDGVNYYGARARLLTTIQQLATGTAFATQAISVTTASDEKAVWQLRGILGGLRDHYADGHMVTVEELIHGDIFGDFMEMAAELYTAKYEHPAAVMAGSVLEEHLRKLAERNGLPIEDDVGKPLKAERINADLKRAEVYNGNEQKSVTSWLGLRNSAAHGQYDEYSRDQVGLMIDSVSAFIIRHPA